MMVLLSAVPKESLSGSQRLCFRTVKGKEGGYLDARNVFPNQRGSVPSSEPELLPEDPAKIVEKAVSIAKEQPVLFWGRSSVYGDCPDWPKDQLLTPVALSIRIDAPKFFDELLVATKGFFFIEADGDKDL